MHNDIRLHLANDEKQQSDIESRAANSLERLFENNMKAFSRHIPTIAEKLLKQPLQHTSIFIDKNSETNIVDVLTGKSFYHFNVDEEIKKQCDNLSVHSALVNVQVESQKNVSKSQGFDDFAAYTKQFDKRLQTTNVDALVIFGIGKGIHIPHLFTQLDAPNIVIYEPSWEIFCCSLYCTDWHSLLEAAAQSSRRLFFQIERNASSLNQDIEELRSAFDIQNILFYKHYNEPTFDVTLRELRTGNVGILQHACPDNLQQDFQHWVPAWTPSFEPSKWRAISFDNITYQNNITAFKTYFPDIFDKFSVYKTVAWEPIVHQGSGMINLFNVKNSSIHTIEDVALHAELVAEHFRCYPNKDGLIFGYEGLKLKHYLHNTFIRRASTVLRNQRDEKGKLPEQIKALILFGLDTGYTLQNLLNHNEIENLFLCEPNPDFFHASLFAINWAEILSNIEQNKRRLYLNVGEASSVLYNDINAQFLGAGPHLLADTYFFQGYDNGALNRVIKDLREQLKLTFSLSETIDHAMYGIEHTKYALHHKIPAMAANAPSLISKNVRQLPLFVVGNGPSLDNTIEIIREYREQILIVSCGTALQALHSYGITPDFHAEVEQCRLTFEWASMINDPEYLKSITLVSVNGIHPDTCSIYKDTLFGFKLGESSSLAALSIFGRERFSILDKAYPTVTNLAVNFFLKLGFTNLYLLGVDLGFVDHGKHHSSQSGYFKDGKQVFDHQAKLANSSKVQGNFRAFVYTKVEFNISRLMMEQVLQSFNADCYNLSDGALIEGALPLLENDVLIVNKPINRQKCIADIKNAFIVVDNDVCDLYQQTFSCSLLNLQIVQLKQICHQAIFNREDAERVIEDCRELVRKSISDGKSLFIYYFYGSLNNLCATLSKALMSDDEAVGLNHAQKILEYWNRLVDDAQLMINQDDFLFDTSSGFSDKLELLQMFDVPPILSVVYNQSFADYLKQAKDPRLSIISQLPKVSGNDRIIVFISCLADMQQLTDNMIQHTMKDLTLNMLIVYTDALLYKGLKQHLIDKLPKTACMMYLPMWVDSHYIEKVTQGLRPMTERGDAINFLLARLNDIGSFHHIVYRAKFDETGLKRAKANKEDEYSSDAVDYLANNLGPLLSEKYGYSFLRYVGFIDCEKPLPTYLDASGNRGLFIPRALEPYELLGEWYKAKEAGEICMRLQEHVRIV